MRAEAPPGETNEILLDATGLRCPLPIIRLAAAAKGAPYGTVVTVLSTDVAAEPDIAAWCRMRGQELLEQIWLDGPPRTLHSRVRIVTHLKGVRPVEGGGAGGPAGLRPAGGGTPAAGPR